MWLGAGLISIHVDAQSPQAGAAPVGLRSPQFLAISVAEVELAARWYSRAFNLDLLKDMPAKDAQVHTRLLHSPELVVDGFFKAGMFVDNLDRSVEILRERGVTGIGSAQSDQSMGIRWVLFRDNSGNFIQLLERLPAGR